MYFADSDTITIVLTCIAIAAGVYSSVKKVKSERKAPLAYSDVDEKIGEEFDVENNKDISKEIGKEVSREIGREFKEESPIVLPIEADVEEHKKDDLKNKLKISPKDMILYSEILRAKYKDF